MGFKAINDKEKSHPAEAGETQEAREARIIKKYESALHLIARGSTPQALVRLMTSCLCQKVDWQQFQSLICVRLAFPGCAIAAKASDWWLHGKEPSMN